MELYKYKPHVEGSLHTTSRHPEKETYPKEYEDRPKGKVFDKKPIKIPLEAAKLYAWCTCGNSKMQVCMMSRNIIR